VVGPARPGGPQRAGELLPRGVAGLGKSEQLAALVARDLGNEVGRRPEAVQAQPPRVPRHHQRAVADQPGAQQRRRLGVAVARGQGEGVAVVGDGVLGVTAVDLVAGEAGVRTEVLAARAAVRASAARPAEPRHAHAVARREALDALALADDGADDLVAEDERQPGVGQLAVGHVQIRAADATGVDPDQHLIGARLRRRQLGGA
jgi:hypothetical protein